MALPHIPFEVAITSKELLKKSYDRLSGPQRTILRALYGLPLDADQLHDWAMLQGHVLFDELGYPLEVFPERCSYQAKEYNQLEAILGRRSGKTGEIGAFIFAYETTCGGHLHYVRDGQTVVAVLISQKKEVAVQNLPFIRLALEDSPLLKKEITFSGSDELRVKGMTIIASSPTMSGLRGLAMPVVGKDEQAFWYKDAESANPDYEVERAVSASQAQFPRYKRFGITSPWSKEGLAYKYHRAGTEGCKLPLGEDRTEYGGILVVEAPTAAMQNPLIKRDYLAKERARDPQGFEREYLARFTDSLSSAFPRVILDKAIDRGVIERKPEAGADGKAKWHYVAAIDPAFRRDSFPLVVMHYEPGVGVVVDALRQSSPKLGTALNPSHVLTEYKPVLDTYGIRVVYSDQGQLETLQELALQHGITIHGLDWTVSSKPKIFNNLQQLLNQGRLRLLDPQLGGPPAEAFDELCSLEKILRPNGSATYAAPPGKHDDIVMAIAMGAKFSVGLAPLAAEEAAANKARTPHDIAQGMMRRKQLSADSGGNWDE